VHNLVYCCTAATGDDPDIPRVFERRWAAAATETLFALSPNRRRLVVIHVICCVRVTERLSMNRREMALLRTKLRDINIEYSMLVRGKTAEGTLVRMEALRVERRAVMALIAERRLHDSACSPGAVSLAGAGIDSGNVRVPQLGRWLRRLRWPWGQLPARIGSTYRRA